MAQALASERSLRRIKAGLGWVTTGLVISILTTLISIILVACVKDEKALNVIKIILGSFFLFSSILILVGNIICLFSGEKHYKIAFLTYVLVFIIDIIIACIAGRTDVPSISATKAMYIIEFIFQFIGTMSVILALRHVNNSVRHPNGFNNLTIGIVGLAYIGLIVTSFVYVFGKFDANTNNILSIVISCCLIFGNIFYTISLFLTHGVLKRNL